MTRGAGQAGSPVRRPLAAHETTMSATPSDGILDLTFDHSSGSPSPVDVIRLPELRARSMDHSIHDPVRLDCHLMQFVLSGPGAHWCDFQRVPIEPGDVLFVSASQVHWFDPDSTHDALVLLFRPEALEERAIPPPPRWQPNTVLRPAAEDFALLVEMLELLLRVDERAEAFDRARVSPFLLAALLRGLADTLAARQDLEVPAQRRAEELVLRFEELLDRRHARTRRAADYAEELGASTRTLARACADARGATPKSMIDARVVLEAKRALMTTGATAETIGRALGFSEATNFVKFFRRIAGTTPEAFRRGEGGGV